jgi:hypothetical protein
MRVTDGVVLNVRRSDETLLLKVALDLRQLVELVVAVGFYMAACRFLETFDIDVHA